MIFNSIVTFIVGVANFLLSLLPSADSGITATIGSYITVFRTTIAQAGWFFPVDTFMYLMTAYILIMGIVLTWKLVRWIGSILTAGIIK